MTSQMDWLDIFSGNLRTLMEEANMTQRELADAACISEASLSKYLRGQIMPNVRAVQNLAIALDCDTDALIMCDDIID